MAQSALSTEEIIAKINSEIATTESLIVEYKEASAPIAPDASIGRISRMDAINNKSVTESALRKSELRLRMLNNALASVGTSDFLRCRKCGGPIPLGRFLLVPESPFCVNCA